MMKAALSIWVSVSLFNMLAALSVGCLGSGRDSPAPNLDHGLAWLSTGPVNGIGSRPFSRPGGSLWRNLHQASGPRPMPSDAWSVVQWPLTEAPVLGRSLPRQWPMVHGPVTSCRWCLYRGTICPALWYTVPHHGLMVGGAPVICHRPTVICQVADLPRPEVCHQGMCVRTHLSGPLGLSVR
jgi:hypothetical protein